ncbi:hypothetical protein ACH5RR_014664 [Cinchona calisaya]|uniref:Uncharacterized protein n=1 Tax=Cinchona calisaya TaxID=153742 RepID=A0ABD2ZU12_9GENT
MASIKQRQQLPTRYNTASSFHSTSPRSSTKSDPSSSTDTLFNPTTRNHHTSLIKIKKPTNAGNFSSMVKKFMETKSSAKPKKGSANQPLKLTIAADLLAEDLKKTPLARGTSAKKTTPLKALHNKLFKAGKSDEEKNERKALTEVKGNTRTLAMVLRSERELLSLTKDQENQISELKLMFDDKNREVEKLKDLCLKQREEIKSLKNAILFPDAMNSQLHELLATQDSELKQAKQLIPSLQRQVTSLTGQLQCLAEDLAEVKADKYSVRGLFDNHSSPRTPTYEQEEATNSLEFSSGDHTAPGSPDDMFLKDLNPCLTPYYKTKSMEFEEHDFLDDEGLLRRNLKISHEFGSSSCTRKLSKSSDCCQCSKTASTLVPAARRSDESKCNYGKQKHHKHF